MRNGHVLLLCMLGTSLLATALSNNAIGPDDCCFSFYPRELKKRFLRSYYKTDSRCPKAGVIFVTKRSRKRICVAPNLPWLEDLMRKLDENQF